MTFVFGLVFNDRVFSSLYCFVNVIFTCKIGQEAFYHHQFLSESDSWDSNLPYCWIMSAMKPLSFRVSSDLKIENKKGNISYLCAI